MRKGKIHVLEIFAGSARFTQVLRALRFKGWDTTRNGFDVMTSKGRHMVMEMNKHPISSSWHDHGHAEHPTRPIESLGEAKALHPDA